MYIYIYILTYITGSWIQDRLTEKIVLRKRMCGVAIHAFNVCVYISVYMYIYIYICIYKYIYVLT